MQCNSVPCRFCPYRKDVPSGVWHEEEYQKLLLYSNETMDQPTAVFACHNQPDDVCTGWLATGLRAEPRRAMLSLRLAMSMQTLTGFAEFEPEHDFFDTHTEAAEHGLRDIDDPSPEAQDAMVVLGRMVERRNNE